MEWKQLKWCDLFVAVPNAATYEGYAQDGHYHDDQYTTPNHRTCVLWREKKKRYSHNFVKRRKYVAYVSVCMCVRVCVHVHVRVRVCVRICMHVYVCVRVCMQVHVCMRIRVCIQVHVCVRAHVCAFMFVHAYVCVHVRVCARARACVMQSN